MNSSRRFCCDLLEMFGAQEKWEGLVTHADVDVELGVSLDPAEFQRQNT